MNSASPSEAEQGTINLDVVIEGAGFDQSASVYFFRAGTEDPGGIRVNSRSVRGQKKIIANIDIDAEANVDDFDIHVRLSGGRGGKGTTLFRVLESPSPGGGNSGHNERIPLCVTVLDVVTGEPLELFSDGAGDYCDGVGSSAELDSFENSLRFRPTSGTRKNPSDRAAWSDASGCNDRACDLVPITAVSTERQHLWIEGAYYSGLTLAFSDMVPGQVSRVEGRILIDKFRAFKFSTPNSDRITCPTNESSPMWLRCDGKTGAEPETTCDLWTLTSLDLWPEEAAENAGQGDAKACLVDSQRGDPIDDNAELDFTLLICVKDESC